MNDNNDFVPFVFMVLFKNHWLLFWSFGIVRQILPTKTTTSDFENKTMKTNVRQSLFSNYEHQSLNLIKMCYTYKDN